jgi:two-component system response regulator FixJ
MSETLQSARPTTTKDSIYERSCVHIVDDDPQFRSAISLLLQSSGIRTEVYRSGEHFISVYQPGQVECMLLDLRMPGLDGLTLQSELRKRKIRLPLIVISGFAETPSVVRAMRQGAIDFLEKPVEEQVLLEKVERALQADQAFKAETGDLSVRLSRLSEREREVMQLLCEAYTTIEVARRLEISPKTVEKHRLKIFDKLDVASVPELICRMSRLSV